MNKLLRWGSVGALVAGLLTFGIIWNVSSKVPIGFYEPSPHVRLQVGDSTGSGVHVGDGLILTAAHVVGDKRDVQVFADDNRLMKGTVLWYTPTYDIALVRVEHPKLKSAPLSCKPNYVGQHIRAYGNPMGVEHVYTSGDVVGKARRMGPWATIVPVDGTLIFGQSGGGVVDDFGNVVGITVGAMGTPSGIAAFGYIVPGQTICSLMGRA